MSGFISELKRRNVFRVAAAYAVGAWILAQVADVFFPALHLPGWTVTLVIVLLILGFPVALFLAWAYEITPEGVKRERGATSKAQPPDRTGRILDWAVIVLLLLVVGLIVGERFWSGEWAAPEEAPPAEEQEIMVAVMPFDNLSPDPADAFFAGGMHGELISQLSQVRGLRVISRTTMLGFEDTGLSIQEIAGRLNVETVMEAEVERVGDRVRIGARLIDGLTDAPIWSDNYEGAVEDIFTIRAEVIEQVAEALRTTVSPGHADALAVRPTEIPEAYEGYLKGLDYLGRDMRARFLDEALQGFQQAVALDPDFAEAWARLSLVHRRIYWFGDDPTESRLLKMREAAQKAYDLAPDLAVVRQALATSHYAVRDYERALEFTVSVLADTPNMTEAVLLAGAIYRRLGRWTESTRLLERTVELDPENPRMRWDLMLQYWAVGRLQDAVDQGNQLLPLQIDVDPDAYSALGDIHLAWTGDLHAARELAGRLPDELENDRALLLAWYDAIDDDYEQALQRLDGVPDEHFMPHLSPIPAALVKGVLLGRLHRPEQSRRQFETAARILEDIVDAPDFDERVQIPFQTVLAFAYAGLGRDEDAVRTAQRSRDTLPISKDALRGPDRVLWQARVFAALGYEAEAIEALEELVSVNTWWSAAWLPHDPLLKPLHGHESFERLIDTQ